jgi:hypothetical protein
LLIDDEIDHGGNPVAAWMASNVAITQNAEGNKKPDKAASSDKIDGILTLIMSIGRATLQPETKASVYETPRSAILLMRHSIDFRLSVARAIAPRNQTITSSRQLMDYLSGASASIQRRGCPSRRTRRCGSRPSSAACAC